MKKIYLDLDGTLLDSSLRHEVLLNELLNERGVLIDTSDYLEYKSNGNSTISYLLNVKNLDVTLANCINLEWINKIEEERYINLDYWYEDTLPFIKFLKTNRFEINLLTARNNEKLLMDFLRDTGYLECFDKVFIVSPKDARNHKKKVVKNNFSEICVVVGDTESDYFCDISDVYFFMLNRGFRSKTYWENQSVNSYLNLNDVKQELEKLLSIEKCN